VRAVIRPGARARSRVVVHESGPGSLRPMLETEGFDLVSCPGGETLLEEVVRHRPDVVVYAMGPDRAGDMGVLRLLRRAAPEVPLVMLAAEGSLAAERQIRDLRPIYYGVMPVDAAELVAAVRAGVVRNSRTG